MSRARPRTRERIAVSAAQQHAELAAAIHHAELATAGSRTSAFAKLIAAGSRTPAFAELATTSRRFGVTPQTAIRWATAACDVITGGTHTALVPRPSFTRRPSFTHLPSFTRRPSRTGVTNCNSRRPAIRTANGPDYPDRGRARERDTWT